MGRERVYWLLMLFGVGAIIAAWVIVFASSVAVAIIMTATALVAPLVGALVRPKARLWPLQRSGANHSDQTTLKRLLGDES